MKKPTPIYFLESDKEALRELAKSEGVTMNALVNKWVKEQLRKAKK